MADNNPVVRTRLEKGGGSVYLIVDTRERAVVPFLEAELRGHAYVLSQINTGDYLICRKTQGAPVILAAIERKTHEDFAASFKDSRYENVKKMRALREATGCQLYFFVEGVAFPHPNRRYARIPFSNILAAITKLMVRDGIFVVQTEDESNSAKRLADFLRVFDTQVTPGAPAPLAGVELPLIVPDALTARIEQTDGEAAVIAWARLRGVSIVLGKILARTFTVAELAAQKVTPAQLRALKTATGRPINKDAFASLLALRSGSVDHAVKVVSGVRSITPAVAQLILKASDGLLRLCALPPAVIAAVQLPQKNRAIRLGATRAERIRRILHYKESPGRAQPESSNVPLEVEPLEVEPLEVERLEGASNEHPDPPDRALPGIDFASILAAAGFECS